MIDHNKIKKKITDFIFLELDSKDMIDKLFEDTSLIESGILDSFSIVKLVIFIEEKLHVEISSELLQMENFENINKIIKTIELSEKK